MGSAHQKMMPKLFCISNLLLKRSPEGMYNLGAMYDNGFGTKRNSKLAAQWFKKSCEAGYEKACEML